MKKIFALSVSLLFVVSVFGVASVMANGICHCDGSDVIMPSRVSLGENFILKQRIACGGNFFKADSMPAVGEYVSIVEPLPYTEGEYIVFTYKALKPGTIYFCNPTCVPGCASVSCSKCEILTIRNEYPILSFMKILGLWQTD